MDPKHTQPAVALSMASLHPMAAAGQNISESVMEGWVLKKRRKKMQGFARRYFVLHSSGLLSYSFQPGQPVRDQISLAHAAISTAPGRKDIHLDSNNATFHIKCLTEHDFNRWMAAFRYIASDAATVGRKSSVSRMIPRNTYYNRTHVLVEEIGNTITELQRSFAALSEEDAKRKLATSRGKDHNKEHTGPVRSLFKHRKSSNNANAHSASHDGSVDESRHPDSSRAATSTTPLQQLQVALESLRFQHSALIQALSPSHTHSDASTLRRSSPMPTALEVEEMLTPISAFSSLGRSSHRLSCQSETSIWFDAPDFDGAEEFVLDETPLEEAQTSHFSDSPNPTAMSSSEISPEKEPQEESDSDTDSDSEHVFEDVPAVSQPNALQQHNVVRRTQLPSPPVGDEGSLFAVLKKNVGKDLTQVALPVSFNEPLTLLQRLAEEVEYYDLMNQAVASEDPVERLCFVAAFAVSGYANTKYRSGRKGFNPMLAETFEDPRMCFIAEKVCHNPVILAYHAGGEGWELYATSGGKTKFWGKSLEIIPQGSTHLVIGKDHYEWTKPSSFMRNLMMGTKYLEHCGKMVIHNQTTNTRCVLEFKESGYWGVANQVSGTILSSSDKVLSRLEGKWDEQLVQKLDEQHLRVLWRVTPFPRNVSEYYGFTSFGITLNEVTPDLEGKLPPTDSRLRPDVRALELGQLDLAESEKMRVEEMQRDRRKRGEERKPRWFKKVGEEWEYIGGYWEQRTQGWDATEPLW